MSYTIAACLIPTSKLQAIVNAKTCEDSWGFRDECYREGKRLPGPALEGISFRRLDAALPGLSKILDSGDSPEFLGEQDDFPYVTYFSKVHVEEALVKLLDLDLPDEEDELKDTVAQVVGWFKEAQKTRDELFIFSG